MTVCCFSSTGSFREKTLFFSFLEPQWHFHPVSPCFQVTIALSSCSSSGFADATGSLKGLGSVGRYSAKIIDLLVKASLSPL